MSQIKVIQIIDSLNVGGAEVLAVNIANGLVKKGIESHLCATRKEGDLKNNIDDEVGYIYLKKTKPLDFKAVFKLKKYIKKHQISIVHAHSSSSFIAFLLKLFLGNKIRVFWHNHSGNNINLKGFKFIILHISSLFFHKIINVNRELVYWTEKSLKHKNAVLLNNFPYFSNDYEKTHLKGTAGKRVVCLAGFRSEKDHINLLEAFHIVARKHPDWTLHLVGKGYNDDYYESLIDFIKAKKLEKNVFLYGMCMDIKYILSQSEIGVLSSKSEGLPISLLEYGLAGISVIVTNVGQCAKVVNHKKAVVTPERSDKFANYLLSSIESNLLRKEIASSLNINVLENYSEEATIVKLMKFYKS